MYIIIMDFRDKRKEMKKNGENGRWCTPTKYVRNVPFGSIVCSSSSISSSSSNVYTVEYNLTSLIVLMISFSFLPHFLLIFLFFF